MRMRRARPSDAAAIWRLIARYAAEGLLLPRAEEEIRRNLSHFLICEEKRRVAGCRGSRPVRATCLRKNSSAIAARVRSGGRASSSP